MKIIALADIHGSVNCLAMVAGPLASADLILIAGDITNFGNVRQAEHVITELRRYNSNILAVGGNCDLPDATGYFADEGISINCKCVEFGGISFVGLAGSLAPGQKQLGDTLEKHFVNSLAVIEKQTLDAEFLILVTHQPARDTAVDNRGGGSDAIYDFIERRQPILAVSGHIHESAGKDTIGKCTLVNPGPLNHGSYAEIEIEDGVVKKVQLRGL